MGELLEIYIVSHMQILVEIKSEIISRKSNIHVTNTLPETVSIIIWNLYKYLLPKVDLSNPYSVGGFSFPRANPSSQHPAHHPSQTDHQSKPISNANQPYGWKPNMNMSGNLMGPPHWCKSCVSNTEAHKRRCQYCHGNAIVHMGRT